MLIYDMDMAIKIHCSPILLFRFKEGTYPVKTPYLVILHVFKHLNAHDSIEFFVSHEVHDICSDDVKIPNLAFSGSQVYKLLLCPGI